VIGTFYKTRISPYDLATKHRISPNKCTQLIVIVTASVTAILLAISFVITLTMHTIRILLNLH